MTQNSSAVAVFLQLWFASLTPVTRQAEAAVERLLSASEVERLGQIRNPGRRREYLLSRALMRHALSRHFQRAQGDWEVFDRPRAPPLVTNLPGGNFIALTHSKDLVCFGLANCPLGIDIEFSGKSRNYPALAKMFMNDAEKSRLAGAGPDRADFFYRAWCAKEACYKQLPAEEQADTPFSGIDYASLGRGDSPPYLCEGRIGQFAFAAVTAVRPDSISCDYFEGYAENIGRLDLHDRQLAIV